jgi:DNA-binding beta-propeller fold protein YncE
MRVKAFIVAVLSAATAAFPGSAAMKTVFAYRLADETGDLPLRWAGLNWDPAGDELYVVDSSTGLVEIFNEAGMKIYEFGDDAALGRVAAVVALPTGDLVALTAENSHWSLVRCNFRGEPKARIEVSGIPFKEFSPGAMRLAKGALYLADKGAARVIAVGLDGSVQNSWDLYKLLGLGRKKNSGNDMRGFNVDAEGNVLGTVPGLFLAFVAAPDGTVRSFGTRGSAPGKFNIVAGIASDEAGRIYVADTLKCAVLIFDRDGKFIDQFGYRGDDDEEGLLAPQDVAVVQGRVFVSQSRGGVKAFDILLD